MNIETITFENNTLRIINQARLPGKYERVALTSLEDVINAIQSLMVRGAPAIGIVAAYGFYIHVKNLKAEGPLPIDKVVHSADLLKNARPTAVNLQWAVDRMLNIYKINENKHNLLELLKDTAIKIHQEDKESCERIGQYGARLISDSMHILTHCNAGILATGGIGTALAPVYTAYKEGKNIHIYVDETRPVGQGARLTYWELTHNNVPATLIADNMAAGLMHMNKIDMIIVGADRIASNGDVANKIGTYGLAVLAKHHGIPFYIAAPCSTFDMRIKRGDDIPIEYRPDHEITGYWQIDNMNYHVYNPAFDITPADLISAIITENGVINKPNKKNIQSNLKPEEFVL
jgi:methylthioribose-1-phosphate isomerase